MPTKNLVQVGEIFNKLTVIMDTGKRNKNGRILSCQCDCGQIIEVIAGWLRSGNTQSCGCLKVETARKNGNITRKHGQAGPLNKTTEYWTWLRIKQRCYNPKNPSYPNYGAKGITVHEEWINNFSKFFEHIGHKPNDKTDIDRIDSSKGYEPGNVRWVTSAENNRNRLNNRKVTINGITKCLFEWIKELGASKTTVYNRLKNGWSEEDALLKPRSKGGIGSRHGNDLL